jgi:hypothetical protein
MLRQRSSTPGSQIFPVRGRALGSAAVFVVNGLLVLYVINFDRKIKQ